MAMEFQYDDSGATFYYFLVSFFGLVLLPVTYFVWPRRKADDDKKSLVCQCEPCRRKRVRLEIDQPKERFQRYARMAVVLVMWCVFAVMVYKVLMLERDYTEYDPYEILELDPGASVAEIRRQYRRLSKVYHPDKEGGDQAMFMRIAKAYEALTDEESKENLEKYGNPDGPQAASFGIALPAWIIEKKNSIWVLGFYVAIFMIVLPVIVGLWWYSSIKYGTTNILVQTTQLFYYYLARSSSLTIKRILLILTGAGEFNPQHSKTAKERPSDNVELNEIIRSKTLPHIDIKTKEPPFFMPYAAKSRILMHSHLERLELPPNTLALDKDSMLSKCPIVMNEMLNVLSHLWTMARYPNPQGRSFSVPSLDTFENVMKVHQMIVQATWERHSPLLQLPHLQPEQLKHFRTRKRNITTIEQFAAMGSSERRQLVRSLVDEEYLDIMAVCGGFPHVDITTEIQVVDDEDHHRVTAGSLVTVAVTLTRQGLLDYYGVSTDSLLGSSSGEKTTTALLDDGVETNQHVETVGSAVSALSEPERAKQSGSKVWEKQKKKKKGKAAASKPKKKQQSAKSNKKNAVVTKQPEAGPSRAEEEAESQSEPESEEEPERASPSDEGGESSEEGGRKRDEEEEWKTLQESLKKRKKKTDGRSDDSHPVHAPFYPVEKQECWWLYIADKRKKEIVTPPQRVTGLQDEHTLDLHFGAPERPGIMRLTVILTSDSYLDLSFQKELKVDVHEKQAVSGTEQWKELEEEEEAEEVIEESESGEEEEEESDEDSED